MSSPLVGKTMEQNTHTQTHTESFLLLITETNENCYSTTAESSLDGEGRMRGGG